MLEQISWKDFAVFATGGCIAYYGIAIVSGKLKIKSIKNVISKPATVTLNQSPGTTTDQNNINTTSDEPEEAEFKTLELLADELQVIITQSKSEGTGKEELLGALRKEILRYPVLDKPAFRSAVTNLIIRTAQQELGMEVNKQEATALWSMG